MWSILVAMAVVAAVTEPGKRCPGSPNQCSLHGSCMINRHGEYICNCQWGYTGFDCAQKMCPHGFDPVTSDALQEKKLRVSILHLPPSSSILVQFHGHVVELDAAAGGATHLTADVCAQVFRRFRNLGDLSCASTAVSADASSSSLPVAEFDLTLHSFPVYPVMNNLFHHAGNPSASDFSCDPPSACRFTSLTDANIKAYLPCSNHGLCNAVSGLCACEPGYHGVHCGSNVDAGNMLEGAALGPFFSGHVLHLSADRAPSPSFDIIHAEVQGIPMLTVNGLGQAALHGADASWAVPSVLASHVHVSGGGVQVTQANVNLVESRLILSHSSHPGHSTHPPPPLLHINVGSTSASDLIRMCVANATVFQVTGDGHTNIKNDLNVGRDVAVGHRLEVAHSSHLNGPVTIQGNVLHANHTTLAGGVTVRGTTAIHSEDLGSVTVGKLTSLVALSVTDAASACLTCRHAENHTPLFDVAASGATTIHDGGLHIKKGGLQIQAGGQTIESGGLTIQSGGLHVQGGAVTIHDTLSLRQGLAVVSTDALRSPLRGQATHPHFAGAVLALDAAANSSTPFDLITASNGEHGTVWRVRGDGSMWLRGGVRSEGPLASGDGPLIASHQALFRPRTIQMTNNLTIPSTHSYVHVTDDGQTTPDATQTIAVDGAEYGQLLIIQTSDPDGLESLQIPPFSSALFVFDGQKWQTLTATEFDTTRLTNVKQLTAAANLNLGAFQLTAHSLQVGGQPANRVALYGKGGVLTSDESLGFDPLTSTLQVHQLQVDQVVGKIDMTNSELRGVDIIGGYIRGINMSAMVMEVTGEMYVESNAYVGGSLSVDGHVMGSGSYVDSSDGRFKINISTLFNALDTVLQLRGVTYTYNRSGFPDKHFSSGEEVGFIAQEMELVLPQVVTTDQNGYKYVAYSRVVPVLVEAVKTQATQVDALASQVAKLQAQVDRLDAALLSLKATT